MPADVPDDKPLTYWEVLKATFNEWSEDRASRLAAAVAYYAIFSIGPLLLIAISIVGLIYGPEAANDQIRPQLKQFVGDKSAEFIQELVKKAAFSPKFSFAGILSLILVLYAATNFFVALQDALNTVFDVEVKSGRGIKGILKDRALSFVMVAVLGLFVVASVVLGSVVAAMTSGVLLTIASSLVNILLFTAIFAALFKYLPDIKIDWKDTLIGAGITSIMFTLARIGLTYYLGRSSTTGPFGAAGSLVAVMLFVYYALQILFLGAEFTQVWARRNGQKIEPAENAVSIDPTVTGEQQGVAPPSHASGATGSRPHFDATRKSKGGRDVEKEPREASPSRPARENAPETAKSPQAGSERLESWQPAVGPDGQAALEPVCEPGERSPHYPSTTFHPPISERRQRFQLASAAAIFAIPVTWLMIRRK